MDADAAELPARRPSGHTIVCGLHDIGLRIIEQLYLAGEDVVVVDDEPEPRFERVIADWPVRYLALNAQRESSLVAAGIHEAKALICAESDDVRSLEIALLGRRLRPQLRVVLQLTNLTVGRAVDRMLGTGRVLDVASLASTSFAEATLRQQGHTLDLDGHEFQTVELAAPATGTLRDQFGDLVPIAAIPANSDLMQVCPGRDLVVAAGDRVVFLTSDADRVALDPAATRGPRRRSNRPGPVRSAWRMFVSFLASTDGPLRLALAALASLALLSVVLIYFTYRTSSHDNISLLQSIYFTAETLTTVGFGDFTFGGESALLLVWAVILMILGAGLVATVYALLTNLLVQRNVDRSMGRHLIRGIKDHIIIVGLGSVGLRVLEKLVHAGYEVVVLDRDDRNRYIQAARAMDVPVFVGDGASAQTLTALNVQGAAAVAALTSNDLVNIETGLVASELLGARRADVPVVMRVFDRQLAATVEEGFGFREARSTSELAAPWFVGAALGLHILGTFYVERQPLLLGRLTITADGGLHGRTMHELSAAVRVVALRHEGEAQLVYPVRRGSEFAAGDQVYVVGPYEELLRVLRRDQRAAR